MRRKNKLSGMEILIRTLIIVVFCASILLTVGLLMELNRTRREIDELKEKIEQYEELGAAE